MNKIATYKAEMRLRKAARMGLTPEQFDAYVEAEQARLDAISLYRGDRALCRSVLATHAAKRGHIYTITR